MPTQVTWRLSRPRAAARLGNLKARFEALPYRARKLLLTLGAIWALPLPAFIALWMGLGGLSAWGAMLIALLTSAAWVLISLIPHNWPLWFVAPIPREKVRGMAKEVAREIALQILDDLGAREVPQGIRLSYTLTFKRVHVSISDAPASIRTEIYESRATFEFEERLAPFSRLERFATCLDMKDEAGDPIARDVPIPQPSNHEILSHKNRAERYLIPGL